MRVRDGEADQSGESLWKLEATGWVKPAFKFLGHDAAEGLPEPGDVERGVRDRE